MEFVKKTNELEVVFDEKIVKLRGHQDIDAFSLYEESLETSPSLTEEERIEFKKQLSQRTDIVIR